MKYSRAFDEQVADLLRDSDSRTTQAIVAMFTEWNEVPAP